MHKFKTALEVNTASGDQLIIDADGEYVRVTVATDTAPTLLPLTPGEAIILGAALSAFGKEMQRA